MVAGFVSVRPRIDAHAATRPPRLSGSIVGVAESAASVERRARAARNSSTAPPTMPSRRSMPTRSSVIVVSPNAAIAPYVASAVATPRPDMNPYVHPRATVRRMTSSPIGPSENATAKPITRPRRKSSRGIRRTPERVTRRVLPLGQARRSRRSTNQVLRRRFWSAISAGSPASGRRPRMESMARECRPRTGRVSIWGPEACADQAGSSTRPWSPASVTRTSIAPLPSAGVVDNAMRHLPTTLMSIGSPVRLRTTRMVSPSPTRS